MDLLKDRITLVTGSSRGIGASIARMFAREGARVALHGRDVAALSKVRADIERDGGKVIEVFGDVTKFSDIEAMRKRIEDVWGHVEILVDKARGSFTPPERVDGT